MKKNTNSTARTVAEVLADLDQIDPLTRRLFLVVESMRGTVAERLAVLPAKFESCGNSSIRPELDDTLGIYAKSELNAPGWTALASSKMVLLALEQSQEYLDAVEKCSALMAELNAAREAETARCKARSAAMAKAQADIAEARQRALDELESHPDIQAAKAVLDGFAPDPFKS
jgi:hypothetical protein